MAAIKRGRKSRQSRAQKILNRRGKLPHKPRRNVCIIRFPRSSYLTSCPLLSWYFNRKMRDDVLSLQKAKAALSPCVADVHHKMSLRLVRLRKQQQQQQQHHTCRSCPNFFHTALREVASKKRAKWVAPASPKKRQRYSDEEIFYRLAKPSRSKEKDLSADAGAENLGPGVPQPTANELQEVSS